jgi:hypothetical protein
MSWTQQLAARWVTHHSSRHKQCTSACTPALPCDDHHSISPSCHRVMGPKWLVQVLEYTNKSLQHLLQAFCGVHTDKSYQQADWTTRCAIAVPCSTCMAHHRRPEGSLTRQSVLRFVQAAVGGRPHICSHRRALLLAYSRCADAAAAGCRAPGSGICYAFNIQH